MLYLRSEAAIDHQVGGGDESALVRGEIKNRLGDLFGRDEACQR
jgi:hypothetical protein